MEQIEGASGPYSEVKIDLPVLADVVADYVSYRRAGGDRLKQFEDEAASEGFNIETLLEEAS